MNSRARRRAEFAEWANNYPNFGDYDDYDEFEEGDCDEDFDFDCGMMRDGLCLHVGSEECDWECPNGPLRNPRQWGLVLTPGDIPNVKHGRVP